MDRLLIYPFEQPQETDLLNAQKFAMLGLAQLAAAALGSGPLLQGLACTPGTGLTVSVAPGQIYQSEVADATAYSSLAADARTVLKQGVVWTPTVLNCPAPGTVGQSINYLVEVGFVEADTNPVILPFYDASNPTVPYNGPNGSGVPSNTVRSDECIVQVKAGTAAATGTQTTPAVDAGFIGAYVVTVAYGAASITTGNIAIAGGAPFISAGIGQTFQVCAGNPNGQLAGTQATAATAFPTLAYDMAHNALWVCTTTGTSSTAVWTETGGSGSWPYWCGTSTGTANAQTLTTPATMLALATGSAVAWEVGTGLTNTAATTLTVGTFGTWPLRKDGPTGPIALTGGELVAGNLVSGRFDGTYIHLAATEMGTAALANASSNTGTVAAVSGVTVVGRLAAFSDTAGTIIDGPVQSSNTGTMAAVSGSGGITAGHLAVFGDTLGTVQDGGPPGGAAAPMYINSSITVGPGPYLTDTSAGSFTLTLPATPVRGMSCEFIDGPGTWGTNNLTIGHNGNTIMGGATDLICNVAGEDFRIWYNGSDWRLE